jgi:hypothetical protein
MKINGRTKDKKKLGVILIFIFFSFIFFITPVSAEFNASSNQSDINWQVYATTPANLTYTTGNFWVNWTWEVGSGRIPPSSWNVSINSVPHNGTTNTFYNQSTTPNGWINITVWGWNSTDGVLSESFVEGQQQASYPFYISGYVKDIDNIPIQNAYVWDDHSFDSNYTNSLGYYIIGSANGTYEITASKTDFHDNSITVTVAGANLVNQNITLAPVLETPTITNWFNNATNNTNTSFSINVSQHVYFNATADQSVTWHWFVDDTEIPLYDYDNISLFWNVSKIVSVSVYGSNANGDTQTVTWTVYVGQPVMTIEEFIYLQNQQLIRENEMIGTTILFGVVVLLALLFLVFAVFGVGRENYFDILSAFIAPTILMLIGYQCFASEALQQFEFLGMLFIVIAAIIYIYAVIKVFTLAIEEFGYGEREEDREPGYEYK